MDNPNSSGGLRRHNSLPSKLQRHSSLLPSQLRLKTNPYIGSFRHSPPTSFRSIEAFVELPIPFASFSIRLKNSPYIGWFRHAPPTSLRIHKINQEELALLNAFQGSFIFDGRTYDQGKHDATKIINGRLRGGCNDQIGSIKVMDTTGVFRLANHGLAESSSSENSSGTMKMLARLGSWFLFPLAYDAESCGYKNYYYKDPGSLPEESTCSDDESNTEADPDTESDDDSDCIDGISNHALSDESLGVSVSNVAEAYYAHQAIEQVEDLSLDGHRLDYVITQQDILKMARNASRHLDVESILKLPTITYHPRVSCDFKGSQGKDKDWSFVMVQDVSTDRITESEARQTDNLCVICMERFVDGDRLRVLPCNHSFHVGCIDRWLSGSHSHLECFTSGCPTCKKRPLEIQTSNDNDGSVPSWAFAQLGDALARSVSSP